MQHNIASPHWALMDLTDNVYNTKIQIKLWWALFVTYTIIQSIMRSEMCSLHLTHPSVHTWSSGQPTVQRPGSSRGLPVGARIRTHNLGLSQVSSPTLYPLGQRLPKCIIVSKFANILECFTHLCKLGINWFFFHYVKVSLSLKWIAL